MALVHKTKKKTQKKQQIFRIKLRKDKVKMFRPHSQPISVVGQYNLIRPIRPDSGQIGPFWRKSEPSRHESQKKKKKKKTQTWHQRIGSVVNGRTPCRATSDSGGAPSQPRCCFLASIAENSGAKRRNDPNHYENQGCQIGRAHV